MKTENNLQKCESIEDAVFRSEWAWANVWTEKVCEGLLGGDCEVEVPANQMYVLLEWGFRLGHRLGAQVSGKTKIDTEKHDKIFDATFEQCRRAFTREGDPGSID